MLIALLATAMTPFTCHVIRVHDGDGPLWCRTGERIRIAGIQAPDFENAATKFHPYAATRLLWFHQIWVRFAGQKGISRLSFSIALMKSSKALSAPVACLIANVKRSRILL